MLFLRVAFLPVTMYAQQISPGINQYPSSVITRVYEIASKVNLSDDKQNALAAFYQQEDSVLAALIVNGATASQIADTKNALQASLKSILSTDDWNNYYKTKTSSRATIEAQVTANFIQQKYNCDTAVTSILNNLYYQRQLSINNSFLQSSDPTYQAQSLYTIIAGSDSLIDKYTYAASSTSYINNKIAKLNAVKPLSPEAQKKIQIGFFNLCLKSRDKSFADNFNNIVRRVITDTAYYAVLYQDKIKSQATNKTVHVLKDLVGKGKITKEGKKRLSPVILEKQQRLATINASFPMVSKTKDSLIQITNTYYDSIINQSLVRNGVSVGRSQFSIALKYQKELSLSSDQVDSLVAMAASFKRMKDDYIKAHPTGKFDSKAFECTSMSRILTDDQYNQLLALKNWGQAKNDADAEWNEMQQRGIATNYNQDSVVTQLIIYHMGKLGAYYRYANDGVKQQANVKAMQARMPAPLRALYAARKYNNPVNTDPSKGQLQW